MTASSQIASPNADSQPRYVAFEGQECIAAGTLQDVTRAVKPVADRTNHGQILVFDERTSAPIEIDFRGTLEEALARVSSSTDLPMSEATSGGAAKRGPGRPKLGVVGREVTLLPRHWDWLDEQPGGPSVALRRLVEEAKRASGGKDRARRSQEAVYRFMSTMAGDLPGYEEALRAFYANQHERVLELIAEWPEGIRGHVIRLLAAAAGDVAATAGEPVDSAT